MVAQSPLPNNGTTYCYNLNETFLKAFFSRLMNWIQSKIPDLPIKNFTADWNDGKRLGALVDSVAPGLCPDWPVNLPIPSNPIHKFQ